MRCPCCELEADYDLIADTLDTLETMAANVTLDDQQRENVEASLERITTLFLEK